MTRKPAAPANLRNGLKWRRCPRTGAIRPRWEPSPANRACGFVGVDLRDHAGGWMDRGAAVQVADLRTAWASVVRLALRDDDAGGRARRDLRAALDALPPLPAEVEARRRRELVEDLIERGRAVLENREPDMAAALMRAPRTVAAMVEGFFADREAMARIAPGTQRNYRVQSQKLIARFGDKRVDEITRSQMRTWYLDTCKAVSVSTANVAAGAAAAMFTWAMWQDPPWLTDNPATRLGRERPAGRRVFYTPEEERAFVPWCDANGYADVADVFTVTLWTGARQIDVCPVDLPELSGKTWRYTPEKTKRKGQEALPGLLSPVHDRVERRRDQLARSPLKHLNAQPFLWDDRQNRRYTSERIGARFREARAAFVKAHPEHAAFADKQLRDTRDTCVTRLWAAGVSLERIASWGGWAPDTAREILREHYLCLLDEGAIESAGLLETWANTQGFALSAA